jgi:hypothetical protein
VGQHFRICNQVMVRKVGEELVFLNLNNEQYYGLDEIGAKMWNALTTCPSVQAAKEQLLDEFDVSPEELSADLDELIAKLLSEKLLELYDA